MYTKCPVRFSGNDFKKDLLRSRRLKGENGQTIKYFSKNKSYLLKNINLLKLGYLGKTVITENLYRTEQHKDRIERENKTQYLSSESRLIIK